MCRRFDRRMDRRTDSRNAIASTALAMRALGRPAVKKHIHIAEIFVAGITSCAIYVTYITSRHKVVKIQQNI